LSRATSTGLRPASESPRAFNSVLRSATCSQVKSRVTCSAAARALSATQREDSTTPDHGRPPRTRAYLRARCASVACRAACGRARCPRFPAPLHGEHAGTHLHLVHFICGHHDGDVSGRARRQTAGRPGVSRGVRYSPLVETTVPPLRSTSWNVVRA